MQCGGARRLGRGGAGQRELVRALLEADDALLDVQRVRVHGRRHDLGEVVREEVGGMEARVARPIPPALPVFCTTGKEAEAPGTAAPRLKLGQNLRKKSEKLPARKRARKRD